MAGSSERTSKFEQGVRRRTRSGRQHGRSALIARGLPLLVGRLSRESCCGRVGGLKGLCQSCPVGHYLWLFAPLRGWSCSWLIADAIVRCRLLAESGSGGCEEILILVGGAGESQLGPVRSSRHWEGSYGLSWLCSRSRPCRPLHRYRGSMIVAPSPSVSLELDPEQLLPLARPGVSDSPVVWSVDVRDAYVAAHVGLRMLLGLYLGMSPDRVRIIRRPCPNPDCGEPHGRPGVRGDGIHFSLSHTRGLVLLAFMRQPGWCGY